jgi:hypothetical protein
MKNRFCALLITVFGLLQLPGCSKAQNREGPAPDRKHIEQVILSLPQDSQMRTYLQRGDHGDGVHHAWMNRMKRLGVQRAKILLDFTWKNHPSDIKVRRVVLFKTYDTNCAQITDPEQLHGIAQTSLEKDLGEFATAKIARSDWTYFEHRPEASQGLAVVDVVDDEWLPVFPPNLLPADIGQSNTRTTLDGDVNHLQDLLKSQKLSRSDLDHALMEVAGHLDDACTVRPLIAAGANPNVQDGDGQTPLMLAAYAGLIHNVEALIDSGADPKLRNVFRESALDIAQRRGHTSIASLLARVPAKSLSAH